MNAYEITSSYLAYGVAAETWFFSSETISPPLLTICIEDVFRDPKLIAKNFSTSVDFFNGTFRFDEIITKVEIHQQPYGQIPADPKTFARNHVRSSILHGKICYTINITFYNNTETRYSFAYLKSISQKTIMKFVFNTSACLTSPSSCEVQINHPQSNDLEFLGEDFKGGFYTIVDYTKTDLFLMPRPYVTQCRNYSGEGLVSQETCFARCLKAQCLKEYNALPARVPIYENENYTFLKDRTNETFNVQCQQKCSDIACEVHQIEYSVSSQRNIDGFGKVAQLFLSMPKRVRLKVIYIPKIDFWAFVTMFGSVFGLWFGFSALSLAEHFLQIRFPSL